MAEAEGANLARNNHAKSVVWDYFGICVGEDGLPVPGEEQRRAGGTI